MASLLDPAFLPFSLALGLLFGLLTLEVLAALAGGTLLGLGGEADLDVDADFDVDLDIDPGVIEGLEAELDAPSLEASTGPLDWLGLTKAPVMVWFAALLIGFGVSGLAVQSLTGTIIPVGLTSLGAGIVGAFFARQFSAGFARLIPKSESAAMSERSLGRRKGVVSQGTAARGKPAEVRVMDGFGNTHYLRAEPMRDTTEIPQGTEVLVVRQPRSKAYRLILLSDL